LFLIQNIKKSKTIRNNYLLLLRARGCLRGLAFDTALKVGEAGDAQARQAEQLQGVPDLLGVGGIHAFVVGDLHEFFDHGNVFGPGQKSGQDQAA